MKENQKTKQDCSNCHYSYEGQCHFLYQSQPYSKDCDRFALKTELGKIADFDDLVPSFELCRKIPFECFRFSAFVWIDHFGEYVRPRYSYIREREGHELHLNCRIVYPAPTLQEIIMELPDFVTYRFYEGFFLASHPKVFPDDCMDQKPVNAAMKLWLCLNQNMEEGEK